MSNTGDLVKSDVPPYSLFLGGKVEKSLEKFLRYVLAPSNLFRKHNFGRPNKKKISEEKRPSKNSSRFVAPIVLIRNFGRGEDSSKSTLGHLGRGENSFESALIHLSRGDCRGLVG